MEFGVQRRVLVAVVLAGLFGGASGCFFDPSGRSFESGSNNGNTANSNNANSNTNVNEGNNNTPASVCGDGVIELGEDCEDGNAVDGDGCASDCTAESGWDCSSPPCVSLCGDGLVVGVEVCDDGDTVAGDGCASDCTVEPFFACGGVPSLCHCVVYVDQGSVAGGRTGGSWGTAVATVQQGVGLATAGCEVWVADGVYYIWQGSDNDTVSLKSDVAVYGGFDSTETQLAQRNWVLNSTVLQGANSAQTDWVYHVVTADTVSGAMLNGFTVTGGNAKFGRHGGGVFITDSVVTLRQLRVADNVAALYGGGIHCWDSTVTLSGSIIQGNSANDGGGVNADHNTQLTVDRCRFLSNRAGYYGGGLRVFDHASATVTTSLFVDNQVTYTYGGAIVSWNATNLTLTNCTLFGNVGANFGGAIYNLSADSCTVRNSILWGNTPDGIYNVNTSIALSHTITQDSGWAGSNGNLGSDPLLLLGYDLDSVSPAIDTADDTYAPPVGLGGNSLVDMADAGTAGTLADMGCFEYAP
jgi:cysteine-rich repeat protein